MIILAGTVRIAAGKREAALGPMSRMVEATRKEPGCLAYSFAFDLLDDHLVQIFEIYSDEAAVAAHRASSHMAEWRAQLPGLGIGDRNLWHYDVSSSKQI